jgi:glutamate synthase domain-containing protein 1
MDADAFERQLYLCRREIEHRTKEIHGFYMPSFSNRLISYKAPCHASRIAGVLPGFQ